MAATIIANIPSLLAQNNLALVQGRAAGALQKLSTGLRVNTAADDAAGYAIAQRMTAQIKGIDQAARNVNDGVSLVQVADGAVAQMVENFQQIRTLAVQAANSVYTLADRQALQSKVDNLLAANTQIVQQTSFNGNLLLDGTFIAQQLQVGANAGQTLLLNIPQAYAQLSGAATVEVPLQQATVSGQVAGAIAAGDLKIDGYAIGASKAGAQPGQSSASAWAIANAVNAANIPSLSASADTSIVSTVHSASNIAANAIVLNGVGLGAIAGGTTAILATNAAAAINAVSGSTGVTATSTAGTLTLDAADGRDISVAENVAGAAARLGLSSANGTLTLTTAASTTPSTIVVSGNNPGNAGLSATTTHSVDSGGTGPVPVAQAGTTADVTSVVNAGNTIDYIDAQIAKCGGIRTYLGATQNALLSMRSRLINSASNLSTARGRIQDTDYAGATAELARDNIVQSAAMAMLAQANAQPRTVIGLLSNRAR
jgi:flagellin